MISIFTVILIVIAYWRSDRTTPKFASNERILVIGQGGSGKSTYAKQLSKELKIPCCNFDKFIYKPKGAWVKRSKEEVEEEIAALQTMHANGYVLEGVYIDASDKERIRETVINKMIAEKHVDRVIWLHQPFIVRIWRIICRSIGRRLGITEQGACPEKWSNVKALLLKQFNTSSETLCKMSAGWTGFQFKKCEEHPLSICGSMYIGTL